MASWGKADFEQLKRLQKKLEQLQTVDIDRFFRDAAKELAARLLAKVIKRTPVGRKPKFTDKNGNALPKTMKVSGMSGKSKTFLTREGAILQQYWSGYVGGTLRRGWTSKTAEEAKGGSGRSSASDGAQYAQSLPIYKNGSTYTIVVQNPVRYASYVEFGHRQTPGRYVPALGKKLKASWVKGQFMLTISEQEIKAQAPHVLEKIVQQIFAEVFNGK